MSRSIIVQVATIGCSLRCFLKGQAGFLRKGGFEVHGISSPDGDLAQFAAEEGVAVHGIEMARSITPLRDLLSLARMVRTLRRIRPVLVHAHTPKGGFLGMLGALLARVPVRVYTIRGLRMATATGFKRRLLKWTEIISCRCAHRVLAVSPSIRDEAIHEGLCPPEKIRVLGQGSGNGVDARNCFDPLRHANQRKTIRQRHAIPDDAPVVGFVGRIVRDKGMVELAAAWRTLREQFPSLHLLLVGPFELEDPVPADVEDLFRTDPRIHCVGRVQQTAPYYATMDVCVLPSYREGLGMALLEAAAMEVPGVATEISGCVDAVQNNVTGLLVPPRDAASLAEALATYLRSPQLRRQHGAAGRARVLRDFHPEAVQQAICEQYLSLLQRKGLFLPLPRAAVQPLMARRRAA